MAVTPFDVTNKIDLLIQANNQAFGNISGTSVTIGTSTITEKILQENNASLSTGLYSFSNGGITMTASTATTFNIGAVEGFIVNSMDTLNNNPMIISYSGQSGLTTPYLLTAPASYFLINSANTLTILNSKPTQTQRRDNIFLGVIGHPNGSLTGIGNAPDIIMNVASQIRAMFTPINFINDGVIPYANGVNLALANTAGNLYGLGIGFITNGNNAPSTMPISAGAPTTFQYRTQTGTTFSATTLINPLLVDTAGVATAYAGSTNQATNQRVFLLQNGSIRLQYGQQVYPTLAEAVAAINSETFVTFSNNRNLGILIGIISVTKGCTNLSDTATAKIFTVSKFGESIGSAAGTSTATLQSAYNNSVDPEITTNSTLGSVTIRRGSASDADNVLVIQNGSGGTTSNITGSGIISGTSIVATNGVIRLKGYTVATLPSGTQGDTAFVTDGLAPSFLTTIVGGGAIVTPVFYNGTTWVSH